MINYESLGDLQPKALTGIAIKKTQGMFLGTDFLPERPWPEFTGYYKSYNDVAFAQLAPSVAESQPASFLNTAYTESSFTMKEYRYATQLSERAIEFLMAKDSTQHKSAGRALVKDAIELITETVGLQEEKTVIDLLISGANSANATTATNAWSSASSTPLTDIREAIRLIRVNWHITPDTLIIDPSLEKDLLIHADVKDMVKYTSDRLLTLGQDAGRSRAFPGGLCGLDVYVSDAVYTTSVLSGAAETALMDGTKAIVMKRGATTGVNFVAKDLNSNRWYDYLTRATMLDIQKVFQPVIFRSKQIAVISGV